MATLRQPDASAPLERVYDDFEWFAENLLYVQDKQSGRIIPFVLKPVQRRLARAILAKLWAGEPVRVIILKARREGVSTLIQAVFYWLCSTRSHMHSITVSHHDDTTRALHGMVERFYRYEPKRFRPMTRQSRRGQVLEFANPAKQQDEFDRNPGLESTMRTVTFENAGAGTAAWLAHFSEHALWDDSAAKSVLDTALQIIPDAPWTIVAIESTARGVANEFHDRWERAERGESDFIPVFFAWYEEPTNTRPAPGVLDYDDEEQRLREVHGVSDEQLAWRRWAVANQCGGDINTFHQEYPSTPHEAFLATGRPYFSPEHVIEKLESALHDTPEPLRGDLYVREGFIKFRGHPRGRLSVWEEPITGEDYLISCDSSEGEEEQDPQCAYVWKRSEPVIVAEWHGHIDRGELGHELYRLGRLYNDALIAVEVTGGWGYTPIAILRQNHYPRLYRRRGDNKRRQKKSELYGFDMNVATRPLALDALAELVKTSEFQPRSPWLLRECLTFEYNERGKPAAQAGKHDDRVMAAAVGAYLWQTEPIARRDRNPVAPRRVLSTVTGY
jgi:hypothetical protein